MSRLILPGILKVKGEQVFNGGIFNGLEYQLVTNPVTGRVWLDRNLGATRVATAVNDAEAYGWLYQWGRLSDGHQLRDSDTRNEQSTGDVPGHGDFIINLNDWRNPSNNNLWQGVEGINNPAPKGFRLATEDEWVQEWNTWNELNSDGAFSSKLKLTNAGRRLSTSGDLTGLGTNGRYWFMSPTNIPFSKRVSFTSTAFNNGSDRRANAFSVRLIRDQQYD